MPHIHTAQVLDDIKNWNKEKEDEYMRKLNEQRRLAELEKQRQEEADRIEAEKKRATE